MDGLTESARRLVDFQGNSLTKTIAGFERRLTGLDYRQSREILDSGKVNQALLNAALDFKKVAGQINVVIHAIGIMLLLPEILEPDEVIESLSIGAGNTGRKFDLETNKTVAEFKFIQWQGGSEVIRQNALFKDYYLLAEYPTHKKKKVYLTGTHFPMKFLAGKRSMDSVLSRNVPLKADFFGKYGGRISKVREYFELKKCEVELVDVLGIIPNFKIEQIMNAEARAS